MKRALSLVPLVLAFACGGSDTEPQAPTTPAAEPAAHEHAGEGHDEKGHAHHFPGAVATFHDVLAPVWHNEGADRNERFCAGVADLKVKAQAMVAEVPEGVDAAQWTERGNALIVTIDTVAATCSTSTTDPALADQFKAVHDAFHASLELLPGGGH